jgi:chromate reductase
MAVHILGISGSLRKGSLNTAALRAAQQLLPANTTMELFELDGIPVYNEDLRQQGNPASVEQLRDKIREADALLIACPEYNYSISGPLKNAIDWASRPPSQPFDGKPIAILGASPGAIGTARAQYHLRQVFVYLNGMVLNKPETMIGGARAKFDEQGNLTDQDTIEHLRKHIDALVKWTERLQASA